MKSILAIFIFCLFTTTGNSQTFGTVENGIGTSGGGGNSQLTYLLGPISERNEKTSVLERDIQGSAYTSQEFVPGALFYKNKLESNMFYRYNAYGEELEIKDVNIAEAPIRSLNRDKSIQVNTPDGKSISFHTFIDKNGLTQNGYLTKLVDGKYTYYKRYAVKYTQPQKAQNSFVPATPARFTKFTEYYISLEGRNRIDELEMKNRKFLKLVPEETREALKQFFKENKIKIKGENDVLKVLNFLNK